jgi:hypothetical protein
VPHQWSRNGYASGKLELIPGFFCAVPVAQSLGFCVVFVVFVVLILLAIVLLDLRGGIANRLVVSIVLIRCLEPFTFDVGIE